MTEKEVQEQNTFSDEVANGYLDFYLGGEGASEDLKTVSNYDKRVVMGDIPLSVQLEPLHIPERKKTDRDRLVAYFKENNWLPKQMQEANIAGKTGLDETLRRASNSSTRDPVEAQVDTHSNIKRYYNDAIKDVRILNTVREPTETYSIEPNIQTLRSNYGAMYVLADMMLAREFLDKAHWPNSNWRQYRERQQFWRGFMVYAARYASESALKEVFDDFFEKAQRRRKFWSEKYGEIDKKIGFLVVGESKAPALSSGEDIDLPEKEVLPGPRRIEIESFSELIPEGAQQDLKELIKKFADKSEQIDRYVQDQGMDLRLAEFRVLGGPAERYEGYIIGVKPKERKPSADAFARSAKPKPNAANSPWVRSQAGYDKRPDK